MEAYLKSQGLWQITQGTPPCPKTAGTTAITVELAAMTEWDLLDNKAVGAIALRVSPQYQHHLKSTSASILSKLKTKTGGEMCYAAIFNEFQHAITYKISGNKHPCSEINKLTRIFNQLTIAKSNILDTIKAM